MRVATWSDEKKRSAAIRAPLSRPFIREDSRVISRDDWVQIVTPSAPRGSLNEVALSRVAREDAERVIDATIAEYEAVGHPTKWCVGPWTEPDDFGERLTRRGFEHWDVRGMGAPTSLSLRTGEEVTVECVDESSLDAFVATSLAGWSTDAADHTGQRASMLRALREMPQRGFLFIARAPGGGNVIGTAAVVVNDDHGYLMGTQVLPAARGRGAYRALVAARLVFLAARGIEYAVTHAREATSAPMLEHLGFETIFRSRCYLR